MDTSTLNIIILIVLLLNGAFIVFSKEIASRYPKIEWINKLGIRIPLAIILIIVPYIANQTKEEINRENAQKEQHRRDSVYEAKQQKYSLEVQYQITEVLAKYGLKYDSARMEIKRLVGNSAKSLPDPELTLAHADGMKLDSISNNTCFFKISISNRMAPASNIKLQTVFITEERGELFLINSPSKNYYIFPYGESLGTGAVFIFRVNIPLNNANIVYCYLKGSYSNITGDKIYHVSSIYSYEINSQRYGKPLAPFYTKVEKFIKEKGIL